MVFLLLGPAVGGILRRFTSSYIQNPFNDIHALAFGGINWQA